MLKQHIIKKRPALRVRSCLKTPTLDVLNIVLLSLILVELNLAVILMHSRVIVHVASKTVLLNSY